MILPYIPKATADEWATERSQRVAIQVAIQKDPEPTIFAKAGRQYLFQAACRIPAVLFRHFKQLSQATACGAMP
jgi:hypothetical protein